MSFPVADPGIMPCGSRVLIQIRSPETRTKGGILLTNSDRETQLWNTQIGKVISVGPLAFHNRNTAEPWPEGAWCSPGDFVRIPKYGGDRWTVPVAEGEEALFVIFQDLDIIGRVTVDPASIKAFI